MSTECYFLIFFLDYDNLCKIKMLFYRKLLTSCKQKELIKTRIVNIDVTEEKSHRRKSSKEKKEMITHLPFQISVKRVFTFKE